MHLCLFASGTGSNVEAIWAAIDRGELAARPALLVTNRSDAPVLDRARSRGIPAEVLAASDYSSGEAYEKALADALTAHGVDFIGLAGYLKKIPAGIVDEYGGRIVNIHPALLPAFGGPGMYGLNVHRAVLERGVRWTGATIHFVDHDYDSGPIILQKPVPVYQDDTPERLAARVLAVEHQLYPEALQLFAEGRVQLQGRRVWIDPSIP